MFIQGTVTIKMDGGMYGGPKELTVSAMISDRGIAYHLAPRMQNKEWYNLTHIATGRAILSDIHSSKIEVLAREVEGLIEGGETIDKATYTHAIGILHRI